MEIFIKTSNESKQSIQVVPEATIEAVKKQIESVTDIPVEQQRLIFSGRVLKDTDTVASVNMKEGNTLHVVKGAPKTASPLTGTGSTVNPSATTTGPFSTAPTSPTAAAAAASAPSLFGGASMPAGMGGPGFGGLPPIDPNMLNAMMSNPEIIRQTTQLMAQHPELLNMAMGMMGNSGTGQMEGQPGLFLC